MSYYRKKPVTIEARKFEGFNGGRGLDLAAWCGGTYTGARTDTGKPFITVPTINGEAVTFPGDWIAKGVEGEFYPIKASIFEATYEAAEVPDGVGTGAE